MPVVDQIWSTRALLLAKTAVFGATNSVRTPVATPVTLPRRYYLHAVHQTGPTSAPGGLIVPVVDQIWSTRALLLAKTVVFGAINSVRTPVATPVTLPRRYYLHAVHQTGPTRQYGAPGGACGRPNLVYKGPFTSSNGRFRA